MSFLDDFDGEMTRQVRAEQARQAERRRINERYSRAWEVLDLAQAALNASSERGQSHARFLVPQDYPLNYDVVVTSPWQHIDGLLVVRLRGQHQHFGAQGNKYVRDKLELEAQNIITDESHLLGVITRSRGGFVDYGVYAVHGGVRERIEPDSSDAEKLYMLCQTAVTQLGEE